jgi:hypothetical protein
MSYQFGCFMVVGGSYMHDSVHRSRYVPLPTSSFVHKRTSSSVHQTFASRSGFTLTLTVYEIKRTVKMQSHALAPLSSLSYKTALSDWNVCIKDSSQSLELYELRQLTALMSMQIYARYARYEVIWGDRRMQLIPKSRSTFCRKFCLTWLGCELWRPTQGIGLDKVILSNGIKPGVHLLIE